MHVRNIKPSNTGKNSVVLVHKLQLRNLNSIEGEILA